MISLPKPHGLTLGGCNSPQGLWGLAFTKGGAKGC